MRIVAVLWPDNTMTIGDTATDVLEQVRGEQWSPMGAGLDGLRQVLAQRANAWSANHTRVADPTLSDDEFLDELERAGMILVERFDA